MKKQTALAVLLAFGLVLSSCGSKKKDETKENAEKTKEVETTAMVTVPPIDLDADVYNYYKKGTDFLPQKLYGYLSAMTDWDTELDISMTDNTFSGSYESKTFTVEGDAYDVLRSVFRGKIDGFKRINEYSFSTHVTEYTTDKFDPHDEQYGDITAHVTFGEPYGFKEPDELILYLPNTPISEMPKETLEWLESYLGLPTPTHLGYYVICNKAEGIPFVVYFQNDMALGGIQLDLMYGIPDTAEPDPENLSQWVGEHVDSHLGARLVIDNSGKTPKASFERGSSVYKDLRVRMNETFHDQMILFGSEEHGFSIVFMLDMVETETTSTVKLRCIESTDPLVRRGSVFTVEKK